MSRRSKALVGSLGIVGLILVASGTLIALNWNTVSERLGESLDAQSEKTRATLFRWGESMSIATELKTEYGAAEPDVAYDTGTGSRILTITFDDYKTPKGVAANDHARAIASFAIAQTKKYEEIDIVEVLLENSAGTLETYGFKLEELLRIQQGV